MVFVDGEPNQVRRYFIWEEAEAGHAEMVAVIHAEMARAHADAEVAWRTLSGRLRQVD